MRYYQHARTLSVGLSRLLRANSEIRAMIPQLSIVAPATGGLPVAYDTLDWGGVFPLGMYSVSTLALMEILHAPFLAELSMAFTVVALAAWLLTFLGFLLSGAGPR